MIETEAAILRYTAGIREKGKEEVLFGGFTPYGKVNTADSTYQIHINTPAYTRFLQKEFGMKSRDIGRINIHVVGEKPYKLAKEQRKFLLDPALCDGYGGIKEDDEGQPQHIIIYASKVWADVNRDKNLMVSLARRSKTQNLTEKSWNKLRERTKLFPVEPRMESYIQKAPVERVEEFLNRLIVIKAKKVIREILIHESSHAREYQTSWAKASKKLKKTGLVNWFLDQIAERDEDRLTRKKEWSDIVEFRVNSSRSI